MGTNWVKVNIPEQVITEVDSLLKPNGYPSRSALVTDATRRWVNELQKKVKAQAKLTQEEEDMLFSWTNNTNLMGAEEADIRKMLLENKSLWSWIVSKVEVATVFVLELKKN